MKPSLDRTLKLLWLVIGALLLLFLLAGGVMVLSQVIANAGAGREAARVAGESRPAREEPRAVRYGMPMAVRGTDTRIVMVTRGTAETYASGPDGGSATGGRRMSGAEVNVMFVDAAGARLLLDRPAHVRQVDYAAPDGNEPAREFIAYVLALDDTNGNGRLDERDAVALYASDLDGRNLRPVLSPPLRYRSHGALGPSRMLVYALQGPAASEDEAGMAQRAFVYDVRSGQLSPHAEINAAAERAAEILRR
ncbi:MAG: hypothetical protein KY467_07735 [Gemmatimonadetes bacterium]|nr:hypothetical protein [Gemmatimonadota bacterium]